MPVQNMAEDISLQLYAADDSEEEGRYEDTASVDLTVITKGTGITEK